jgi:hypothetical protein
LKLSLIYPIRQQKEVAAVAGRTRNKGSAVKNTGLMITALVNDARTHLAVRITTRGQCACAKNAVALTANRGSSATKHVVKTS